MRNIYLTRHGESLNNILTIIGGDSSLSDSGRQYGLELKKIFSKTKPEVFTSELKRTKETADCIGLPYKSYKGLNEIFSGKFEDMKLNDIKKKFPTEYAHRNTNKLNNSYDGGESYIDLSKRVVSVLDKIDFNRPEPLLIISHQAVCRVIYSYLTHTPLKYCVNLRIDLHKVIQIDLNKNNLK